MKNLKQLQTVLTVVLLTCAISAIFTVLRQFYFQEQGKAITNQLKDTLESTKIKKGNLLKQADFPEGSIGILKIPSLKLEAPIYEGTDQSILKYAIRTLQRNESLEWKCSSCFA